jgi:glycosyltransferase involved in cell wall biosynthesis
MIPVAILFDNFGPYHLARLRAAAAVCHLLAIEVAGQSHTYAWENQAGARDYKHVTLFEKGTSAAASRVELIRRLEAALAEFHPAVVVVPGWASVAAWAAMRWCLAHRVPMVCLSDSTVWDEPRAGWKESLKRQLVALYSSALVAGTRARDYIAQLGLPEERASFGFDVVDNSYFAARANEIRANPGPARSRHRLPPNYFLASARFVAKKNLPRLLEACALHRDSSPTPWPLVILGDGALRPALERQRDALGLREFVFLPGFRQIDELPAFYALAGAFILPSIEEPWGLVVNEAMASGLTVVVSTHCGCVPELVHDGLNGFTFDPLDPAQLARRMDEITAPGFPRDAFRLAGEKIIAAWSPERFAEGLAQAVTTALTAGPVTPTWVQRNLLTLLLRR